MSQEIWDSELPEWAVPKETTQIGAPRMEPMTDAAQPMSRQPLSRREAREIREREEAAALTAHQVRPRKQARAPRNAVKPKAARRAAPRPAATRPASTRPASVLPPLARRKVSGRALLAKLMSLSAMVGVAGMLVATSVPANAFFSDPATTAVVEQQQGAKADIQVQSVGVDSSAAALTAKATARDSYTVVSLSDQLRQRYGNQVFTFTNNPNGTIQWPFATSVPISSGFGDRVACSYCSSHHLGVDFVPGLGAPIQSIADGVVREVNVGGSAYGVNIIIDHLINGEKVTSMYAHMLWGSPAVAVGQTVTVGQYLGDVGSTGASTGPHLHLEIHVHDVAIDPFAWLKANAN